MTTHMKWNHVAVVSALILLLAGSNANAEENTLSTTPSYAHQQQQKAARQQAYDQQYKLPHEYKGKYYPNDETAIGYHGTKTNAQNDPGQNGSYYYYYY